MTTQLLVVPITTTNLVNPNGSADRQLQFLLTNIVNNVNQNTTNVGTLQVQVAAIVPVPAGGTVLHKTANPVPIGWSALTGAGSTVTINGVSYTYITHP